MDKFVFNDIVFNVGVCVDIFDVNQLVLKDKYLMYFVNMVVEVKVLIVVNLIFYLNMNILSFMGDDYVVYVDNIYGL